MDWPIVVGEITEEESKEIGIPSGKIVIDEKHYNHILTDHAEEFSGVAIGLLNYLKMVANGFTAVMNNNNGSFMLVLEHKPETPYTFCMVEVKMTKDRGEWRWEIRTAQPRRKPFKAGKYGRFLIWKKKR